MATADSTVTYRDLAPFGHPGYRVGDDGSVWSCWERKVETDELHRIKSTSRVIGSNWSKLKPDVDHRRRCRVRLFPGTRKSLVHRLVLEAFVGSCPPGMECCHNDGNPLNNALGNLRWDTQLANMEDMNKHGTRRRGELIRNSKLTASAVRAIRAAYAAGGITHKQLGQRYGVTKTTIGSVLRRRQWTHVI